MKYCGRYITEWGLSDYVRTELTDTTQNPGVRTFLCSKFENLIRFVLVGPFRLRAD